MVADDSLLFMAAYSTQAYTKLEATINICRTSFICVVLSIAAATFTNDARQMVLDPLERMIEKVKLIAKNPLAAASEEIDEAGLMSFMNKSEEKVKTAKELHEAS